MRFGEAPYSMVTQVTTGDLTSERVSLNKYDVSAKVSNALSVIGAEGRHPTTTMRTHPASLSGIFSTPLHIFFACYPLATHRYDTHVCWLAHIYVAYRTLLRAHSNDIRSSRTNGTYPLYVSFVYAEALKFGRLHARRQKKRTRLQLRPYYIYKYILLDERVTIICCSTVPFDI